MENIYPLIDTTKNEPHPILDKLKKFLIQKSPEYAYMVNGKWGSGKTFFLNKQLPLICKREEYPQLNGLKIRYVSANGVIIINEILNELFLQNIGAKSTGGKAVSKMLGIGLKALNHWTGVDLNEIDPIEFSSFSKDSIIIIDDLERVHKDCDLIGLLGQINSQLVEHNRIKIILVCDESKIEKRFDDDEDSKTRKFVGTFNDYKNAKEKLVSHTLIFKPQIEIILPELIEEIGLKGNWNKNYTEILTSVCKKYRLENVRTIKYFLQALKEVVVVIGKKKFNLVFSYICYSFLPQTIVAREGNFSTNDEGEDVDNLISSLEDKLNIKFAEKERLRAISQLIISSERLDEQMKTEVDELISSRKLGDSVYLSFHTLISPEFLELEDDEFDNLVKIVIQDCRQGKYNLTQLVLLLDYFEYFLTSRDFDEIKSRLDIANLIEPALNQLKPGKEFSYASLRPIESRLEEFNQVEYATIKKRMISLEKKLRHENESIHVSETLSKILKTGEFDGHHTLQNIIRFVPSEKLQPLIDLYIKSNQFKKVFNDQVKQLRISEYYSQNIDFYKFFVDAIQKESNKLAVPGKSHFNTLKKQVEEYEKKYKSR